MSVKVKKKDGRLEEFDQEKIRAGVVKAGASSDIGKRIAGQVETWAQSAAKDGVVGVEELKTQVLVLLQPVDLQAANNFETYKKPESTTPQEPEVSQK